MMRVPIVSAIVGMILAVAAAQDVQQAPPRFRSTTDAVMVEVSVRNGTKVITGLEAKDFVVLDNGVRQDVAQASYGKLPVDVTVALDISFSVNGAMLDRLRRAVVQMMSDLGKDDRLKLITFNMKVSRVVDFTNDVKAVEAAIRATSAGGATSIFDTLGVAFVSADHPDRRQLVVVFTDGDDSMSTTEPQQLIDVAQRSNATLTAVLPSALLGSPGRSSVLAQYLPMRQHGQFFTKLATETGGLVIPIASQNEDLTATFRRALDEFRSSYVLYFTPTNVDRGGFHTLTVTVPQNKGFTVRTRRGYWGE